VLELIVTTSPLLLRGVIEGFYGPPWSHAERLAHLEFSAEVGMTTFVYAPKDDPYHRALWREPYPDDELARLARLAARAGDLGLDFTYAIHPATSMRYSDDTEHETLAAKARQLLGAGVRSFALLFDDVPYELRDPADRRRYGDRPGASGAAHGETSRRFRTEVLAPSGIDGPLLICPTDYAGTAASPYRDELGGTAPEDALIAWTGSDVVVGTVSRDDIDRAAESFGRRLVLWDNFPVNDFEPSRLFLGPLTGRTTELAGSALVGIVSNPMPQAEASRFALATAAEWAADPSGYDPVAASRRAVMRVAGTGAAAFEPLVRACSGWPPSAPEDPRLQELLTAALDADAGALDEAAHRLSDLEHGCRAATVPESLVGSVRPWLDGASDTAAAGLAAVRLLDAASQDPESVERYRARARAALDTAEEHYCTVLRRTVPPFVRAVLDRTAPAPGAADERPRATMITGDAPDAADRATAEFLDRLGFAVSEHDPDLVVLTASASVESAAGLARRPVPVIAWRAASALGMARTQESVMIHDRITVVDSSDPLAAGHDGALAVYRGWAWMTVAEVDDRYVVARAGEQQRAALYRYAAGDRLADGSIAPAARIGVPLGGSGPARWLLTPAGQEVFAAAVRLAASEWRATPRGAGPRPEGDPAAR
jgi:hypothetical protein